MENWQQIFIAVYAALGLMGALLGYYQSKVKKNPHGKAGVFNLYGAFVWADIVVFGVFWAVTSVIVLFLNDWTLFFFAQSLFWVVRSLGETTYWFIQQFHKPVILQNTKTWAHSVFPDNYTAWFVNQILWQCLAVVALIASFYFGHLWLTR